MSKKYVMCSVAKKNISHYVLIFLGGRIIGISSIPRLIGWNVDDRLALYALYTREKEFYRLEERSDYLFTHR